MPLNDVPLAIQTLNATQNPIRVNFQTIDAAFAIDHVPYTAAGQGRHNKVSLPVQGAAPATAADEVALFSAVGINGNTELCFRRVNSGAIVQCTARLLGAVGWTRLPSGILIKWGNVVPGVAGQAVHAFPVGVTIPVFAHLYSVQVTVSQDAAGDRDAFVSVRTYTINSITVYGSRRTALVAKIVPYEYLAIGD